MRCAYLVFSLLVLVASVLCEQNGPEVVEPRPVDVIYLMKLLNQPFNARNDAEITSNYIRTGYPVEKGSNKFFLALAPRSEPKENREKRSPTKKGYGGYGGYGGHGGNGCNVCQSGGHYPSGGGYGSGGSFSHAQASASSSSFSGGYGRK